MTVQELTAKIYQSYPTIWQNIKKYFFNIILDDENIFSLDFYYGDIYISIITNEENKECELMIIPFNMLWGLFDDFFRIQYRMLLFNFLAKILNEKTIDEIFEKYELYQQEAILNICEEIKRKIV
jgi:hypothetical protein